MHVMSKQSKGKILDLAQFVLVLSNETNHKSSVMEVIRPFS